MADLLFRLFIKDYNNVSDPHVREKYGVLGSVSGIALNVILCIIKICIAILSMSVSILTDAFNNLSDALSSIITLIGFKMSSKPADKQHPFGHGRIEYISSLFVAVFILYMGIELAKSSFEKIISAEPIIFSYVSVTILTISILIKLWMFLFYRQIGQKISSQSIIAASKDSLSDCVATTAVLIGMILFKITALSFDGYIGLIVAAFILYTGYQTIRDSLSPLLGQPPSEELVNQIKELVMSHDGVIGMHDLIIHNYGPTRFMLSLHAEVSADDDVIKLHDTIDLIEKKLCEKYKCDAVIHLDPIETNNALIFQMRAVVENIIYKIDARLSIHDFRLVTGPTHTNLIFDLVVPYDFKISDELITSQIQEEVRALDSSYFTVINIDKNYI